MGLLRKRVKPTDAEMSSRHVEPENEMDAHADTFEPAEQARIILAAGDIPDGLEQRVVSDSHLEVVARFVPGETDIESLDGMAADGVVLVSDLITGEERLFISDLEARRPELGVVLLCGEATAKLKAYAMDCGIIRVVECDEDTLPEVGERIVDAFWHGMRRNAHLRHADLSTSRNPEVIALFGTKGGTGKTSVAVNLAVSLQQLGKRIAIADLDLRFGDVKVFLDINRAETIAGAIEEGVLEQSTLLSYLYPHSSGVSVLCAPESPEFADLMTPDQMVQVIGTLKRHFDYTIIDLPPTIDEGVVGVLQNVDRIFFVVNPDISTLHNAHTCLDVLETLDLADKVSIILNKEGLSDIGRKKITKITRRDVICNLPYDIKTTVDAVNMGVPFVIGAPKSPIARQLNAFSRELVRQKEKAGETR